MKKQTSKIFAAVVLAVILQSKEATSKQCSREGLTCKDCHTVGNCMRDGRDAFKFEHSSLKCPGGVVCDETSLYCERKGFCRFKKFTCPRNDYEEEVVFPDPYSCIQYHGCQGTDQYDYVCSGGTAFDPVKKTCSLSLDHHYCKDYPVPLCENAQQKGNIKGTDYHYECVKETAPIPAIYPKLTLRRR